MKNFFALSFICLILLFFSRASAEEPPALIPLEKDTSLDSLPSGLGLMKKNVPERGKVNIRKREIAETALTGKKDPLIDIAEPSGGTVTRSFQRIRGRVGGGIAKVFLRVNGETQVVSASDGAFEAHAALKPGANMITALAWDLEGNLGKASLPLIMKSAPGGPSVRIKDPPDGAAFNITADRVITVEAETSDPSASEACIVLNNIPRRAAFEKGKLRQELALFPGTNELFVEAVGKGGAGRSGAVRIRTFDARPKDLVAVLTWDSPGADMDLHVWDSFGHHTFNEAPDAFLSGAAIPGGSLDMDRKGGYGPEVFSLDTASPEVYTFFVKYNPGLKEKGAKAYLRVLLHGDDPVRKIVRGFGPVSLDEAAPVWEAARVKMPEGVFFQEKDADLARTLGMDEKAVKRLALVLEEENRSFGLLAIAAMGQIKSETAVGPLVKALAEGAPEVRRAAAGALHDIKAASSVPALLKALKDTDSGVRREAASALGSIGDRASLTSLTALLVEEVDTAVRTEAIRALGRIGDPQAFETLAAQAKDTDPKIKVEALRSIGMMKEPKGEPALTAALDDGEEGVREVAAWALGMIGRESSARALSDLLRFDGCEGVRAQAALALGRIKGTAAGEELRRAIEKDGSERVRSCAGKSLEGMEPVKTERELPPVQLDDDVIIFQ